MPLVANGMHPVRERLLDQRERDVEEELAGELEDIPLLGKVLHEVVAVHLFQNELDLEALVLGSGQVADAVAGDIFLQQQGYIC